MISTLLFLKKGVCASIATQDIDTTANEDLSSEELLDMITEKKVKNPEIEIDGEDELSSDSDENAFFEEYNYDPAKDPHVTNLVEDSALDLDDQIIRADDFIILSGVSETDEVSHLDLCLFEKEEDNIYTHHDYLLPAFPLALAWLDYPIGQQDSEERKNLVAVATFEPYIEIWDLDKTNTFPAAILGGPEDKSDISSEKGYKLLADSHQDSVLGLSWNKNQRNALASASADKTVKLWDLQSGSCVRTFNYHTNKVQSVQWNPQEAPLLVTGGFDSKIILTDVRLENAVCSISASAEIESIQWLPPPMHNLLLVSFENGMVNCYDILQNMKLLWQLGAHTKPVHALAVNSTFPGLIATGAPEKESPLKIWDVSSGSPVCLYSKTTSIGPVFSLDFSPDDPLIIAVGVQAAVPKMLDLGQFSSVGEKYRNHIDLPQANFDFGSINYTPSVGIATKTNQTTQHSNNVTSKPKKKGKKGNKKKNY